MKPIKFVPFLLLLAFQVAFQAKPASAQEQLYLKKDSIKHTVDTIAVVTLNGNYSHGAFAITSAAGDTLKPQARYYGSSDWVTTSVKNIRTQTSDTNLIILSTSASNDYEINDPCIIAFRLVKPSANYVANRVSYIYYRFRRGY